MTRLFYALLLSFSLLACNAENEQPAQRQPLTAAQQQVQLNALKLDFETPVRLDSSAYVMYPLLLDRKKDEKGDYFSSSSGDGGGLLFWNISFYNTSTGEYHLLDDQRKMLISAYDLKEDNAHFRSSSSGLVSGGRVQAGINEAEKLIFYTIRTTDFNHDGMLDGRDPAYLFVSDKTGRNFRQISPDSAHVDEWLALSHTNNVLLQINRDTNGDKKFDSKDEVTPMIYSTATGAAAKDVFSPEFRVKTKQQLNAQWPQAQ